MTANRVVKNAAWIIAARIVQAVLNLLITMLTARYLGPSNFGLINYAMSIVAFVVPVMQLGINSILVQELISTPKREGEILGTAIGSCLVSGLLSLVGVVAFVCVANHDSPVTIGVCALYSITLLAQAVETIQYWFQAKLLSQFSSLVSLAAYFVTALYKAFLLIRGSSIYWFALANTLDFSLISVALLIIYRKQGGQNLTFSFVQCRNLIHRGKYFILSGLMITVFSQTDRVMLNLMIGDEATGYYSAAMTCAGMSSFVFLAILDSVRPAAFSDHQISQDKFQNTIRMLYSVIIYLAVAQSIGIALLAKPVIYILFGQDFAPAIPTLRIIIWYSAFSYIGPVRNIWLLAEELQGLIWKIDLSGALANVLLNLILIPFWGIQGAAFASLLTQVVTNVIMGWVLKEVRPSNRLMVESIHPKVILNLLRQIRT